MNNVKIYIINFLMAIATTVGMTLLPLIATDNLGLSLAIVGIIEGGSEFLGNSLKLITGWLFDKIKNKKLLFVLPTFVALLSKAVLFFLCAPAVIIAKAFERLSNGTFSSPRDAYVARFSNNIPKSLMYLTWSKTLGCVAAGVVMYAFSSHGSITGEMLNGVLVFICSILCVCVAISVTLNANDITVKEEEFSLKDIIYCVSKLKHIFVLAFIFS